MKIYDPGFEDNEKKVKRKKADGKEMKKLQRYLATLNSEQVQRMMDDSKNAYVGNDPTAQAIFRKAISGDSVKVQAQLEVSQPGDAAEMQANKVAEAVSQGNMNLSRMTLQQQGAEIRMKGEGGTLTTTPEFDARLEQTKGGGEKMDTDTKEEMEGYFGGDLNDVRIHKNDTADKLNNDINAKAFTQGKDIYFKKENYNPQSKEGKELLAHELTHTVQQTETVQTSRINRQINIPETGVGGLEYSLTYQLFEIKVPGGELEGSLSLSFEKDSGIEIGSSGKNEEEDTQFSLFKSKFDTKNTNDEIGRSFSTSFGGLETESVELFPGTGIQVSFSFDVLSAEMEKDDFDLALVEVSGKISGEITKPEQLKGTPWESSQEVRFFLERGYKISFGGTITYRLTDVADIARLVQIKSLYRQLKPYTEKIYEKSQKLDDLNRKRQEIWDEEFKKYKEKKGIDPNKKFSDLTEKQKKKFRKKLYKNKAFNELSKKVTKLRKQISKLNKLVKPLLSKIRNLASKMTTPLGKLAAKLGIKMIGRLLARLNLIVGIVMLIYDILVFIRFAEYLKIGFGEMPNLWDELPDEDAEDGGGSKKQSGDGQGEGETDSQKSNFQQYIEDPLGENNYKDEDEDDDETETGEGDGDGKEESDMKQETMDMYLSVATSEQMAVYKHITDGNPSLALDEDFLVEFMQLPLAGLSEEQLALLLKRLDMGSEKLDTPEEILAEIEKLIDTLNREMIEGTLKQESGKRDELRKEYEENKYKTEDKNNDAQKGGDNTTTDEKTNTNVLTVEPVFINEAPKDVVNRECVRWVYLQGVSDFKDIKIGGNYDAIFAVTTSRYSYRTTREVEITVKQKLSNNQIGFEVKDSFRIEETGSVYSVGKLYTGEFKK